MSQGEWGVCKGLLYNMTDHSLIWSVKNIVMDLQEVNVWNMYKQFELKTKLQ